MLNKHPRKKLLHITLCLMIFSIVLIVGYKLITIYLLITNIKNQKIEQSYINYNKINLTFKGINIHFLIKGISITDNKHSKINIQEVTGKINILSLMFYKFYQTISIEELLIKDTTLIANSLYKEQIIPEIKANITFNFVKMFDYESSLNIKFNLDNINFDLKADFNIHENQFRLINFRLFNNASNIRQVFGYLPETFINKKIITWMDSALLSGHIKESELLINKTDTVSLKIQFEGIDLQYAIDFPIIEKLSATMLIVNNNLNINIEAGKNKGSILNEPFQNLSATLTNLNSNPLNNLVIKIEIEPTIDTMLAFFKSKKLQHYNHNHNRILLFLLLSIPMESADDNSFEESKGITLSGNCETEIANKKIKFGFSLVNNNLSFNNHFLSGNVAFNNSDNSFVVHNLKMANQNFPNINFINDSNNSNIWNFMIGSANGQISFFENQIKFYYKNLNFNINGIILDHCTNDSQHNKDVVCINGEIYAENFGKILKTINIEKQIIKKSNGSITFNLKYIKNSSNSLYDCEGNINLNLNSGVIVGLDPGLGRIIGLFNLDNIQRRLQLDFSDIISSGFTFDNLKGSLILGNGSLLFNKVFLNSPAANLTINGNTSLATKQLNLYVEVDSKVVGALPLATAIAAGNPAIGAALWLFSDAFGSKIGRLKIKKYKISGTWEQPEINQL